MSEAAEVLDMLATTKEGAHAAAMNGYRFAQTLLMNGQHVRFTVAEAQDDITVKQRGFLHAAVLPQISEQVRVEGERYVMAIWKEFFRKMFLPDRWVSKKVPRWDAALGRLVQPKRATPHRERVSTESLGIKAYAEYIDKVIAHAATEFGVVFVFDEQEREAVRYRAPVRKARARVEAVA